MTPNNKNGGIDNQHYVTKAVRHSRKHPCTRISFLSNDTRQIWNYYVLQNIAVLQEALNLPKFPPT